MVHSCPCIVPGMHCPLYLFAHVKNFSKKCATSLRKWTISILCLRLFYFVLKTQVRKQAPLAVIYNCYTGCWHDLRVGTHRSSTLICFLLRILSSPPQASKIASSPFLLGFSCTCFALGSFSAPRCTVNFVRFPLSGSHQEVKVTCHTFICVCLKIDLTSLSLSADQMRT